MNNNPAEIPDSKNTFHDLTGQLPEHLKEVGYTRMFWFHASTAEEVEALVSEFEETMKNDITKDDKCAVIFSFQNFQMGIQKLIEYAVRINKAFGGKNSQHSEFVVVPKTLLTYLQVVASIVNNIPSGMITPKFIQVSSNDLNEAGIIRAMANNRQR